MRVVTGLLAISIACLNLVSCMSHHEIHVCDVAEKGWKQEDHKYIFYDNRDTISTRSVNLIVRHLNNILYDRINLEVDVYSPSGNLFSDTVTITMKDSKSKMFAGKRVSNNYDVEQTLYKNVRFREQGNYRIVVSQCSHKDSIAGIAGVGINIE